MNVNVSQIYKAMSYMNKRIENNAIDNCVIFEEGDIYLLDLMKIYKISTEEKALKNNFVINKEELAKIKTKNAKYFIQNQDMNKIFINVETKVDKNMREVPIFLRDYGIKNILNNVTFSNSIDIDGMALKDMLKGMDKEISFDTVDDIPHFSFDGNKLPLKDICTCDIKAVDNHLFKIIGQNISDCISQLGVTKKNNTINMKYNNDYICFTNNDIQVYHLGNK